MPAWSKSSWGLCVKASQREGGGRRKTEGGGGGGEEEEGRAGGSGKTPRSCPQEISVRPPQPHTPDPENMYNMYMIWRCTNTIQIICWKRFTLSSHPEPNVHIHTNTFLHTWTYPKIAFNVARTASIRRWRCGESAWLSSEFTWLSKVVNPERQGQRGS